MNRTATGMSAGRGKGRSDGWSVGTAIGMAAATASMLHAGHFFEPNFLAYQASGSDSLAAFAMAAGRAGAEVILAGGAASLAAIPLVPVFERGAAALRSHAADLARDMRAFFAKEPGDLDGRRAVLSNDAAFSAALRQALDAAGAPHLAIDAGEAVAVLGFADRIDAALSAVLSGHGDETASATVICLRPNGTQAPTAMVACSDGSAAALWAGTDGRPIATVGYGLQGQPCWVYSHASGRLSTHAAAMEGAPLRAMAALQMAQAREDAGAFYEEMRGRMIEADRAGGCVLVDQGGTLSLRNREGHLDSACGAPAQLEPDGKAVWACNGKPVCRKDAEELAELAGCRAPSR